MKKTLVILSIVLAFCMIAAELPPAIPSGFYGTVSGVRIGAVVTVSIGDHVAVKATTFYAKGYGIVYSLDVPMDDVAEGTIATFKIGGIVYGRAVLHSGMNVRLNLHK